MNDVRLSRLTGVILMLMPISRAGMLRLLHERPGERATKGISVGDLASLRDDLAGERS
jgi:hypothetical protein